ncbi:MAG: permease [Planctomycetota bacterium]
MKKELKIFAIFVVGFCLAYFVPWDAFYVRQAGLEAFLMLQDYAREHVLLCLVPAFFIAGAISVFVSHQSVMKYLGPAANKVVSYSVAAVSGTVLTICSCTVLPIFAGIYTSGAGLGPACAFLYSGPAINVLAIILTARILGFELGIARAIGAILFSIVIGLLMHFIFLKEEREKAESAQGFVEVEGDSARPLWKTAFYIATMVAILVFANWGSSRSLIVNKNDGSIVKGTRVAWTESEVVLKVSGVKGGIRIPVKEIKNVDFAKSWYTTVYNVKFYLACAFFLLLIFFLLSWFKKSELGEWGLSTWGFAKQIFPLLLAGIMIAGFLLGRPGQQALIPEEWIKSLVGGNSITANLLASFAGTLLYFCTLGEVPIIQGLVGSGMGKGPALALLLSGPALSLPSILVIRSVLGTKKTLTFVILVVILSTTAGIIYGSI